MYKNLNHLRIELQPVLTYYDLEITIHDHSFVHEEIIDRLVTTAVFSPDETLRIKSRRIIHRLAKERGLYSSSLTPLYKAFSTGTIKNFTLPVLDIPVLTYDICRRIFRIAKEKQAAAFIIGLDRKVSEYTYQTPEEFTSVVFAAAIKEQYTGAVFLQGSASHINADLYNQDKTQELQRLKDWLLRLLEAGFRNVEIDTSALVDTSRESPSAEQKNNAAVTALLTQFLRQKSRHTDISLSTTTYTTSQNMAKTFDAFMDQYLHQIPRNTGPGNVILRIPHLFDAIVMHKRQNKKTTHVLTELTSIGKLAKKQYGLGGVALPDVSDIPTDQLYLLVETGMLSLHLSSVFEDLLFSTLPEDLQREISRWLTKEYKLEWQRAGSQQRFLESTRKHALGPYKQRCWNLSENNKQLLIDSVDQYINSLFEALGIANTRKVIDKYISQHE